MCMSRSTLDAEQGDEWLNDGNIEMIKKCLSPEFKNETEVIEFRKLYRKKLYKGGNVSKPNFEMNENCKHGIVLCKVVYSQKGKTAQEILTRTQAFNIVLELHKDSETHVCNQGGINSIVRLFNSRYYYKGIRQLTESVLKHCTGTCKLRKKFQISAAPLHGIRSSHVMHEIQCDIINIPCKKGIQASSFKHQYKYIMVTKDCFSKFCYLSPLQSKKAAEIAEILQVLFEEHGATCYLHTDYNKNTPYSVFFGRTMDRLSCEVQKIQCKGFLEEDFLVQITDDTEDYSNILDLSECVANNKCSDTKMVVIDSAFAERCGEFNEQIKLIKRGVFEETEKCIFKNKRAHI